MNTIAKNLMLKGFLPCPISIKNKIPAFKDFKNYSIERANQMIDNNFF